MMLNCIMNTESVNIQGQSIFCKARTKTDTLMFKATKGQLRKGEKRERWATGEEAI